ncbi:hypothetical protein, partial [Escherichia coli]|uniref:hypothetical protein n=1 Tax=Escherichia coli TaxID=562 RepID=UPI00273853EE
TRNRGPVAEKSLPYRCMAEKGIQGRRHCSAVSLMVGGDYITTERRIKQFYVPVVKFVYYIKQIGNMLLCVNVMLTW